MAGSWSAQGATQGFEHIARNASAKVRRGTPRLLP
jgi:hypothetical protein